MRVPGYFNTWPKTVVELPIALASNLNRCGCRPVARGDHSDALTWLRWLDVNEAKLVWARSNRTSWKAICWQFGISRATAHDAGNMG